MDQNYLVLARKYRPSNFNELKGQEFLVTTLVNAIKLDRVAHTFLFTGIRGSGKTTTARIIAKTLNCESAITENNVIIPCNQCKNCAAFLTNNHPDVIELDAASRTGVDDVRNLIENTQYSPLLGKFKIYIIDEIHMLSTSAFNALLKTLEEPPEHVKFIFATTELRKIPLTILSRCQKFELRRLTINEIVKHLNEILKREKIDADKDAIHLIASHAGGSVRDSLSLLDLVISNANNNKITISQIKSLLGLTDNSQIIDIFESLISGNTTNSISQVKELYYAGKDLSNLPQQLMILVHTISKIKLKISLDELEYDQTETDKLEALAEKLNIASLTIFWQILYKSISELQTSSNLLISTEMLMIRLCHISNIPTPADLIEKLKNSSPIIHTTKEVTTPKIQLNSFKDLVQLFFTKREMLLYHYLVNDVHLIEFAPLNLKIRQTSNTTQNFLNKITALLYEWTGEKWIISLSTDKGEPTLYTQEEIAQQHKIDELSKDDIVQEVLQSFSNSKIKTLL